MSIIFGGNTPNSGGGILGGGTPGGIPDNGAAKLGPTPLDGGPEFKPGIKGGGMEGWARSTGAEL